MAALSDLVTVMLCAEPETEEQIGAFRRAYEQVLRATTHEYFPLRMPTHPAVHAIALEAPYFDGTLAELAESRYTSVRHVQRVFVEETGLTFARWRTRARLNLAIVGLRTGAGIRQAMTESGFTTRHGLLKALQRECGLSADLLSRDPAAAVATLAPTSTEPSIPHTQGSNADEPHSMAPGA